MPWIHFHSGDKGVVKACCVANIPYGNINNQSLQQIWEGEPINNLRTRFIKGIPDKRCFVCVNREKSGNKSIRQETFEKYSKLSIDSVKTPIYFDIRFSNVCNFKCKTCWHGASSKWFEDAKKLGRNVSDKAIIQNITDYEDFISKTGESLLGAKEIYFAGGEPLVTEEHYLLLDYLIENNATTIHLRYNTNFSKLSFKKWDVLKLWSQFGSVEVMASVDDYGINGENIRRGFNWELFKANRAKLNHLPHIDFKVSPTVSVYNIKELPAFYAKLVNENIIQPVDFYINLLERPYYFNIKVLAPETKIKIGKVYQEFLTSKNLPLEIAKGFKSIIDFMNEQNLNDKYWKQFLKEDKLLHSI